MMDVVAWRRLMIKFLYVLLVLMPSVGFANQGWRIMWLSALKVRFLKTILRPS